MKLFPNPYVALRRRVRKPLRGRTVEEANTWNLYLDIAWFGVLSGIASAFLSIFALRLGASNNLVGMLTAIPALINIVWLVPAARIIERQRHKMPVIILSGFLHRFAFLLIALMPFFVSAYRAQMVVALVALSTFPAAMANVAFTSMMADVVPLAKRARIVSVRNILVGITSTTATLLGGKFLDYVVLPLNYQILFTVGFLSSLLSLYYVARIKVTDAPPAGLPLAGVRRTPLERLRSFWGMLWSRRPFVRFSVSSFVWYFGLFLPIPLYSIYWVRTLHATDGWIGLIAMVNSATSVLAYPFWGRLASRRGNRPVLLLSTLGLITYPVLTAFSPSVEPLVFVAVLGGIFGAGLNLSLFNTMLEVCPDQRRPSYIAAYTTVINVATFLAPLLGTALIDVIGIQPALLLGGALRFLGFLFYFRLGVGTHGR
ncbi:MAG: MFS transporter [Chloroflexi bacterium]|nr:MFS transporter [Chloroflexota bacterium]